MKNYEVINFSEIKSKVPQKPGLYEIYTKDGFALKVGISSNLMRRLSNHFASRQNALQLKTNGCWSNPEDVVSKSSILAKHLYFSDAFAGYDLKKEDERRRFLQEQCLVKYFVTGSRAEAREIEKRLEAEGKFQFVGKTTIRI